MIPTSAGGNPLRLRNPISAGGIPLQCCTNTSTYHFHLYKTRSKVTFAQTDALICCHVVSLRYTVKLNSVDLE